MKKPSFDWRLPKAVLEILKAQHHCKNMHENSNLKPKASEASMGTLGGSRHHDKHCMQEEAEPSVRSL